MYEEYAGKIRIKKKNREDERSSKRRGHVGPLTTDQLSFADIADIVDIHVFLYIFSHQVSTQGNIQRKWATRRAK